MIRFQEEGRKRKQIIWSERACPGPRAQSLSLCPVKSHYLPTRTQVQREAKPKARAKAHPQRHSEGDQRHTAGLNRRACASQGAMSAAVAFSRPFNRNPKRDLKTFSANKIAVYILKKNSSVMGHIWKVNKHVRLNKKLL